MSDTGEELKVKTGDVSVYDLVPCLALCCCVCSMYAEIPDCFGSVCENIICCVGCKILSCKTSKEENVFCKCLSTDCDIIPFATCCQVSKSILFSFFWINLKFSNFTDSNSGILLWFPHFFPTNWWDPLYVYIMLLDRKFLWLTIL